MALTKEKIRKYTQRLLLSRMRILNHHSFYGLLLMRIIFSVDENVRTAQTNGTRIVFGTDFLEKLSDSELDFVMMHEILHVVLQHCSRGEDLNQPLFNVACDIVINSNILLENNMDLNSITLKEYGESMHLAPDGSEGYLYNAEEVYVALLKQMKNDPDDDSACFIAGKEGQPMPIPNNILCERLSQTDGSPDPIATLWDDHSLWGMSEDEADALREKWERNLIEVMQTISIDANSESCGPVPLIGRRMLEEIKESKVDWRALLQEFIRMQERDYTFAPPDRRFSDSDFFLPDFNENDPVVEDILFMVDTSGSMSNKSINEAYTAIKDGIDQFSGKLSGWVAFFDTDVVAPVPFNDDKKLDIKQANGGGGTSFHCIFDYIKEHMTDRLPAAVVILTDGFAPWPPQKNALGVPVLWLINNRKATPPWGKVVRMI